MRILSRFFEEDALEFLRMVKPIVNNLPFKYDIIQDDDKIRLYYEWSIEQLDDEDKKELETIVGKFKGNSFEVRLDRWNLHFIYEA